MTAPQGAEDSCGDELHRALRSLTGRVSAVAEGALDCSLDVETCDSDVADLTRALIRMRDRLVAEVRRLERERQVMERVAEAGRCLEGSMDYQMLAQRALGLLAECFELRCATYCTVPEGMEGELQPVGRLCCDDSGCPGASPLVRGLLDRCRDDHAIHRIDPLPASVCSSCVACGADGECFLTIVPLAFDHSLLAVIELVTARALD